MTLEREKHLDFQPGNAEIDPPRLFEDEAALRQALRPLLSRGPVMHLVVDASPTFLAAWGDGLMALRDLLARQPAFRDVVLLYLAPDDLSLRRSLDERTPAVRFPTDQPGPWIIWFLTDGVGTPWRSGGIARALASWAGVATVAVLDVLGTRTWDLTDLGARRVRLEGAGGLGGPGARSWTYVDALLDPDLTDDRVSGTRGGSVPVPVLEPDPSWISPWARYVATDEPTSFTTTAVITERRHRDSREFSVPDTTETERLENFFATASSSSKRLAGLLSVETAQMLGEHEVRTVVGMAGADRRDLSEIFAFGLLYARDETAEFNVLPAVRRKLRALVTKGDEDRVRRAVEAGGGDTSQPVAVPGRTAPGGTQFTEEPASTTSVNRQADHAAGATGPAGQSREAPPSPAGRGSPAGDPATPRRSDTESDLIITMTSTVEAHRRASDPGENPSSGSDGGSAPQGGTHVTSEGKQRPLSMVGQLPIVWGNVPPKNPHFTGREDMLAELHRRLEEGTTTVLPEALHGMGGIGKTQLAAEYVYRHMPDYDVVWWIPAERKVGIGNALVELGERLGLQAGTEFNVAVRQVIEALRRGDPYHRWLLVFDNAEDPAAVREYFPPSTHGHILVTSRNPSWVNVGRTLEVPVFDRDESKVLLRSRGGPLSDADADAVAARLGDLPLAVEQAVTWRAETGMSAQEYLRLLEVKLSELLGTPPTDYSLPVTAAWNLALDQLKESSPAALELLQVCAFFAPEPISRQLLSRAHNETIAPALDEALRDPVLLNRALREINRYALARIDHRDNSIVMHRLVQAVLKGRMTPEEQQTMRHGAHVLLAASDPNDPDNPALWATYGDLYPHLLASRADESADRRVRQLLVNEVRYLWEWGDHEVGRDLARDVHAAWAASFGEEDTYSVQIALWYGWLLLVTGRNDEAAEVNQDAYEVAVRVHGEDSELAIQLMGNVVSSLRNRGDFAQAYEVARDARARALRVFGPDEPMAMDTAHNLAASLRLLGRYREAAEVDEGIWEQAIRLYGEDTAASLGALTGLSIDRRELGDYLGGRAAQENVYARYERLYPAPDHPARLRSARNLAVALRKAGAHDEALKISKEMEERYFNRYGGEHPATLAAATTLSIDLRHADELHEALHVSERARRRYTETLGPTHPHTLATAINLAIIERLSGRPEGALDLDQATFAGLTERLGELHPTTLACAANMASDLYALRRFPEAYELDVATVEKSKRVLGDVHPATLAVTGNLAMDLRALERKEEALDLQARTLTQLDEVLGRDHPAVLQLVAGIRLDIDVDPAGF